MKNLQICKWAELWKWPSGCEPCLCKHEDPRVDPKYLQKKPAWAVVTAHFFNFSMQEVEANRSL